jgi:LDH2 family malate/lactate/ureidoglycolate dehydrogenase
VSARSDVLDRLRGLGFGEEDATVLADHFLDAEARGRKGHGLTRVGWLSGLPDLDPGARPERVLTELGFERWEGRGALGYLTLSAICRAQLESPPEHARVIVAAHCFPTGMLGHWVRKLAEGGLVAALTATSPARLPHPEGGEPLAGTNPLAIAIPSSDGQPIVADVSMGKVTYGDVLAGKATKEDLVPFGGEQAHKAFALALGLQLLVDALAGAEAVARDADQRGAAGSAGGAVFNYGAVMVVARPEADPVPQLRARAAGLHLPGDR